MVSEWAKSFGAAMVAISEISAEKRKAIEGFGIADVVLRADDENLNELYRDVSNGGFDVVFDCAGVASAINSAIKYAFKPETRDRKCFTGVALPHNDLTLDYYNIVLKEIEFKGSKGHLPSEFEFIISALAAKKVSFKKYITETMKFSEVQEGFEKLKAKGGSNGKAMIIME